MKTGFKTTSVTRPLIIAQFASVIRDEIDKINSVELLRECLSFVRNEHGRAEAEVGMHDDRVMSMCIAHYIREQQEMTVKEEVVKTEDEERQEQNFRKYINYGV